MEFTKGSPHPLVLKHDDDSLHAYSSRSPILAVAALFCCRLDLYPPQVRKRHAVRLQRPMRRLPGRQKRPHTALLVSDIHFDPFHDPAGQELAAAPVSRWRSICRLRLQPISSRLLLSFSRPATQRASTHLLPAPLQPSGNEDPPANARFMTVSGDLIAHAFTCRYATLFPSAAPGDYEAFVVKTMAFVMDEIRASFPEMPVYVALAITTAVAETISSRPEATFLPRPASCCGRPVAIQKEGAVKKFGKEFGEGGYYSFTMAEPMRDTRLIVVNDLFLSPRYSNCAGHPDPAPATEQMKWLESELKQARASGQRVWLMGHIPPASTPTQPFQSSRMFAGESSRSCSVVGQDGNLMVEYADTMRLGIFGHTHMDEMRLLEPEGKDAQAADKRMTAVKMVPSISPVDGNNPSSRWPASTRPLQRLKITM